MLQTLKRPRWTLVLFSSIAFMVGTPVVVELNDQQVLKERHKSIAKDIAREQWRRQQLGLPPDPVSPADADDGFAKEYMTHDENREVAKDILENGDYRELKLTPPDQLLRDIQSGKRKATQ